MDKKDYVIEVNGPGSSGKSSAAFEMSIALGFSFISTGNIYRSYAWALQVNDCQSFKKEDCIAIMDRYNFEYVGKSVFYNGKDIANDIGYEELALKAATLAKKPWYRKYINEHVVLPFIKNKSIVIEGRGLLEVDANPDVEFYLKSTIYARAMRRLRQYKKKYGVDNVSLDTIYKQIKKRDDLDMLRTISPLKINKGTKVINNTCLKREETVKRMLSVVHARFPELVINWDAVGQTKKHEKKHKK